MLNTETHDADGAVCIEYSSEEARAAMDDIIGKVVQIRNEHSELLERKIDLYERSLGLAVIPVLLRRALIVLSRTLRGRK